MFSSRCFTLGLNSVVFQVLGLKPVGHDQYHGLVEEGRGFMSSNLISALISCFIYKMGTVS